MNIAPKTPKKIVAIIPARGGSKSIPKKNVKLLAGKPLIAHPIELAKSIPQIDRVVVSTDSGEIAAVAKEWGAQVPFIRPAELAQDETPTLPVLQHCVKYLEEQEGFKADIILLLYPTCPFLKRERVMEAIKLLLEESDGVRRCNSVVSVTPDKGRFWEFNSETEKHRVLYPKQRINRQYYKPLLRENGAIYFSYYNVLMEMNKIVDDESIGFVSMPQEEVIDIDTPYDWQKAEGKIMQEESRTLSKDLTKNNNDNNRARNSESIKTFTIKTPNGPRVIGGGQPAFIIAEVSANHSQDFNKAVEIIRAAAASGADAVKLQTYTPDTITINCDNDHFVISNEENPDSWQKKTLYQLYQKAYTPWEWHAELKRIAEELGLVFFSTPFDETAVDFLETLDVPLYKVASYEATHIPLLKKIAQTGKPVLVSVGFATEEEVARAVKTLRENGTKDIALLHCVTAYAKDPLPEETNLKTMLDLRDKFDVVCGFSDNNAGTSIPLQAVLMGASIVEKHVIADSTDETFDADFSVSPSEFASFVTMVHNAQKAIGTVKYGPQSDKELKNKRYRRSIFVAQDIKQGEPFTPKNVRVIRPAVGLEPMHYEDIIGKVASTAISRGTPLSWEMVQDNWDGRGDQNNQDNQERAGSFQEKPPKISIIIRTHNNEEFIQKSVASALNQEFKEYEIIVVNDGSTDETRRILDEFIDDFSDPQLTIIHQQNKGAIEAGYVGLNLARGEYVTFLDGDDELTPNALFSLYSELKKSPDVSFAYSDYYEIDLRDGSKKIVSCKNIFNTLACGVLFAKSALQEVGFWKPNFIFPEYDLLIRLRSAHKGVHVPSPLYIYNRHNGALTSDPKKVEEGKQQIFAVHGSIQDFKEY